MNVVSVSLVAFAGAYLFMATYWALLARVRRQRPDHLTMAGLCASLAGYAASSAWVWEASDPGEAARAQVLLIVSFMVALALFTEHALRIVDEPLQPAWLQRGLAALGAGLALSGLFYDPAVADASYVPGVGRPLAEISAPGLLILIPMAAVALFALHRMFGAARSKRELVAPALLCAASAGASLVDLLNRALELDSGWQLGAHGALLLVIGFTYVAVGRITQVETELADRKEALAKSYDAMRTTQEELVRKEQLAAVGELSAVIAHEVRNPLAIIKNAVSGLRRDTLKPDDADTLLSILDEETDRLDRLIDDLLAYAKPISVDKSSVDLRQLVAHAVELAAGGYPDIEEVEIELDLDRPADPVEGDEALLRHALINIVDNALQAMPDGGVLTVTVRETTLDGRPSVAVEVHDTGEGMDTQVRSRARDPFFTTRQTGTGLGLAIVERVANAHEGKIELESRYGQGTTVSLVIPRRR